MNIEYDLPFLMNHCIFSYQILHGMKNSIDNTPKRKFSPISKFMLKIGKTANSWTLKKQSQQFILSRRFLFLMRRIYIHDRDTDCFYTVQFHDLKAN